MKTAKDPRHQKRREVLKLLFAQTFSDQPCSDELVQKILKKKKGIDRKIASAAPAWPVDKLNRVDLAILELAVFELGEKITPPKVIIDEAIELAKEFGSEASSAFVNGVLGTIYSGQHQKITNSI